MGRDSEGVPAVRRRRDWEDILQESEARREGAGRANDRRGASRDDRRGRSRWRRRGERGGVFANHEEDKSILSFRSRGGASLVGGPHPEAGFLCEAALCGLTDAGVLTTAEK